MASPRPQRRSCHPPGTTMQTSPSESPHNNDVVAQSTDALELDQKSDVSADPPGIPSGSAILRKPVEQSEENILGVSPAILRPNHKRNVSSLSDVPTLPSPEPQEAKRQSRQIEALPDIPSLSARKVSRQASSGRISAHRENFDEEIEREKGDDDCTNR